MRNLFFSMHFLPIRKSNPGSRSSGRIKNFSLYCVSGCRDMCHLTKTAPVGMILSSPKVLTISETGVPGSMKPLFLKSVYFCHEIKFPSDCVSNNARHQVAGSGCPYGLLQWTSILAIAKGPQCCCGDSDVRACAPSGKSTYAS
jgi:hypothetical protein